MPLVARFDGPVVDVGSGGGAPGIPLAAALPDREVVLLEASRRKCDFLESVAREFPNVQVVRGRAEEQEPEPTAWRSRRRWRRLPSRRSGVSRSSRPGGAAILLVGPSADADSGRARVARSSAAASPRSTPARS